MGSTIEDTLYEMHLEEEWKEERKRVAEALEKIANSNSVSELQNNLDELKHIYGSVVSIDDENVGHLISELNFSLPKLKEYLDHRDEKAEKLQRRYFILGLIFSFIVGLITPFIFEFIIKSLQIKP